MKSQPRWWNCGVFYWVGAKAGYLLAIAGACSLWNEVDMDRFNSLSVRWPRRGEWELSCHFATWDAAHYLLLSQEGYSKGIKSCAFYPLWPLLLRAVSFVYSQSHVLMGLLVSNACSVTAWALFHRHLESTLNRSAARWSHVFLVMFPGSLFFQFNYSESVFFLLVILVWIGLEKRCYSMAAPAAMLLSLTRGVGVFVLLAILADVVEPVYLWFCRRRDVKCSVVHSIAVGKCALSFPFGVALRRGWLLLMPLAGWFIYLALMRYWTGNPFEGFEAQKYWGVHSINKLLDVPTFVVGFLCPTDWHEFRGSLLDRCVFLVVLDCLPLIWVLDKRLLLWTYMLAVLPAMSGTFTSFTRFASCAFPMFIALGVFFAPPERRWFRYGLLSVFAVLHVILLWRFVNFRWAG